MELYVKIPIVHERRRFTDVMDEEIDDERKKRRIVDKYTAGFVKGPKEMCALDPPKRLKYELPSRVSIMDAAEKFQEEIVYGAIPFIREKPSTCAIRDGEPLTLTIVFTGDPVPVIQWVKNDIILGEGEESERITITTTPGKSTLTFSACRDFDVGLYKVVARNTLGQVTHRFRLVQGHLPGPCDTPVVMEVSDTEVLVRWRSPIDDGGSQILCYHLQMKPAGDTEWYTVAGNIDHEFYLVRKLAPNTVSQFRVAAKNTMGWGDFSASTAAVKTLTAREEEPVPKVELNRNMQYLQGITDSGRMVPSRMEKRELDYSKEKDPVKLKKGENAQLQVRKYNMVSELSRGKYSVVSKCVRTDDRRQFVAKVLPSIDQNHTVMEEYEVLKFLRHERIAQLYEVYSVNNVTMFVMEPLSGVDVLTYLANQFEYSEQHLYYIVTQVLDALSYLHWRGHSFLDIQPDNVVLTTIRRCDVKLVDFGSAQKVSKLGSTVPVSGLLDYIAPEVLAEQKAYPNTDIWSLGVLMYTLLAGNTAFRGDDDDETKENILFVRYRFEHLGQNTSQEAIRFLMLIFKKDPRKRPTVDECRDHRWLTENDFMTKKRERATFFGTRLKEYDQAYHRARALSATKSRDVLNFNNADLPQAITYNPESVCTV